MMKGEDTFQGDGGVGLGWAIRASHVAHVSVVSAGALFASSSPHHWISAYSITLGCEYRAIQSLRSVRAVVFL